MGKCNFKQISTFDEFCKSKRNKTIKENNELSIEVPFWDQAIETLLGHIHSIAGQPIEWNRLIDYIKRKFIIIGRDLIESEDQLVLAHIADVLFQNYGYSWLEGDVSYSYTTAELGSKALVLSTLADEILHIVKQEAGQENEPEQESPNTVAKVYLTEPYDDFCERRAIGYEKFTQILKESVQKITTQDDKQGLDYVLNTIEQKAGSLKLDDILKIVEDEEYKDLKDYVRSIAEEYMMNFKVEINGLKVVDKNVLKVARKLFALQITREVLDKITKENLSKNEEVK